MSWKDQTVLPAKFTQDCSAPRPPLLQGSSEVSSLSAKATSQHSLEGTSLKSSRHIQRQATLRGTHDLVSKAASWQVSLRFLLLFLVFISFSTFPPHDPLQKEKNTRFLLQQDQKVRAAKSSHHKSALQLDGEDPPKNTDSFPLAFFFFFGQGQMQICSNKECAAASSRPSHFVVKAYYRRTKLWSTYKPPTCYASTASEQSQRWLEMAFPTPSLLWVKAKPGDENKSFQKRCNSSRKRRDLLLFCFLFIYFNVMLCQQLLCQHCQITKL